MGHGHHHIESKNIRQAFFINLVFTVIEVVGGLYTGSMAILSDALHDAGDCVVLGMSWYFQNVSYRKRDQDYSYGYRRYAILASIINVVILAAGSILIIVNSIPRLIDPTEPNASGMIILSIVGIAFNGIAFLRLKRGHSHNEKIVGLHLLEDVLGWIAILVGSVVMYFYHLPIIDPILSLVIAVYILFNAVRSFRSVAGIILQKIPDDFNTMQIVQSLVKLDGICEIHDVRAWTMDGQYNVLTAHLVLEGKKYPDDLSRLKREVRSVLALHGIHHSTLEFETQNEICSTETVDAVAKVD